MRATAFFITLFFTAMPSFGQSRDTKKANLPSADCYRHEVDPRTNQTFVSREEYQSELERWNRIGRPAVGPIDLIVAYRAYRSEKPHAETLGTDKAMHCYIGCVISLATSSKVTDYVGWLKEYQDLTDCDPTTHFEDADSVATSRGARLGARDHTECSSLCVAEFDSMHVHSN